MGEYAERARCAQLNQGALKGYGTVRHLGALTPQQVHWEALARCGLDSRGGLPRADQIEVLMTTKRVFRRIKYRVYVHVCGR
jgi:hypothetical protein